MVQEEHCFAHNTYIDIILYSKSKPGHCFTSPALGRSGALKELHTAAADDDDGTDLVLARVVVVVQGADLGVLVKRPAVAVGVVNTARTAAVPGRLLPVRRDLRKVIAAVTSAVRGPRPTVQAHVAVLRLLEVVRGLPEIDIVPKKMTGKVKINKKMKIHVL